MFSPTCRIAGVVSILVLAMVAVPAQTLVQTPAPPPAPAPESTEAATPVITLQDAISRAEANDPGYATAVADRGIAHYDRGIARSSFLPVVTYHNQYLYTQPNGELIQAGQGVAPQPAPIFIANNAVHEYTSQALVTETLNMTNVASLKRSDAASAKANADLEIARRTLVVAVVTAYYTLLAEEDSVRIAQLAETEAQSFVDLTGKLERAREVAHADVVKANLVLEQRKRDLADAQLAEEKARLDLGAMVLPDPRTPYRLADSGPAVPTLPSREESEAAASKNNPELKSALAALQISDQDVSAARSAWFPDITLNYTYGIDAPQFAVNGPDGVRNLGYSAFATLDIPVWDWMATRDRVKQSELRRNVAKTQLTATQKKLVANLEEYYSEAKVASDALASLDLSAKTAEESLRLTKLKYSAGEATALEVVDAQNAATQAETARADGAVRYRVALANLQALTGVL